MGRRARVPAVLALMIAACAQGAPAAQAQSADDRYSLVHGCFALRSVETGNFVVKAGSGYEATAPTAAAAEPFRMQATDLGRYLLYGAAQDFLGIGAILNNVNSATQPSDSTDWTVNEDGGDFRIVNEFVERDLAVGAGGALTTVGGGAGGSAGVFGFEPATGCADYPEIDTNVTGSLPATDAPDAPVEGFVETHMHQMAFEFLGSKAHCGKPWDRFGAPYALKDCDDHAATNGCTAILETALSGTTCHNPGGWPDFSGWPDHRQLTHEQSYYKWLERSWRGGVRVFVNLLVENRVLCSIYPIKPVGHSCDEMETVRVQAQRMRELERYIDAQSGGPGKGWYRIVDDPVEARRVINDGKLAVIMGMEISEPFGCRLMQPGDVPTCTEDQVEQGLDELWDLGVRQLELINKFDNGLAGVAGDSGTTGTITNTGNFLSAGRFWNLNSCNEPVNHDHSPTGLQHNNDQLIANGLLALLPGGTLPVYGPPPHCNQMGLTALGEQAIEGIVDRGMIFDPDHMSVEARKSSLDLLEELDYSGVISSHSWSTPDAYPRIYELGGTVFPYAGDSTGFVDKWRQHLTWADPRYYFGFGYGADINGLGAQGNPRGTEIDNPVTYPFEGWGGVTVKKQRSGERVYDLNADGVAHYGLYPDWFKDLELIAEKQEGDGADITTDMQRGAEAYLQMWERALGVSNDACREPEVARAVGLFRGLDAGLTVRQVLLRAGQPHARLGDTFTYCAERRNGALTEIELEFGRAGRLV